jgi:branched-chain amino acid transport system ATP-binding protein
VAEPLLEVEELSVNFGGVRALRGVSVTVSPGEVVALIGSNGAGKTTTLRTISRLVQPVRGEIRFEGESLLRLAPHLLAERGIAHVPEGRHVFGELSVLENLLLGGYSRGRSASTELESIFDLFPILRERRNQTARTLSGGEQQQLAIGRALMARPRLLMLDEPSLGLAPLIAQAVFRLIARIREGGTTVVLVEQNARAALKIADRGYLLETGTVVLEGAASSLLDNELVVATYLGRKLTARSVYPPP